MRFYGDRWSVDTPAGECAAFGAFSRHFRPGAPVRKWHYDKGRYTQGRTSRPQSPATRVFFSLRARYTFSRNSKFQVNAEPRNALVSRASAVLRTRGGDDRNKHRKRKTHSAAACSLTESAGKNCRSGKLYSAIAMTITRILQIIRRWRNKKETASHPSPWIQLCCSASTIARQ